MKKKKEGTREGKRKRHGNEQVNSLEKGNRESEIEKRGVTFIKMPEKLF